jgi:hypothetical protein
VAFLDVADLLAKAKLRAGRPTTDEDMGDTTWYSFLSDAQLFLLQQITTVSPFWNVGVPTAITSSDSGLTYTLPSEPIGPVAITDGNGGRRLRQGSYDDPRADYVQEGTVIRMARGVARTFSRGLYAQYVAMPTIVDGSTPATLKPTRARILMVPYACYLYAIRHPELDAMGFLSEYQKLWSGDPNIAGEYGLLGDLKKELSQQPGQGGSSAWWRITGDIF